MTDKSTNQEVKESEVMQARPSSASESVYMPEVDICEDGDKVLLVAEMPGVERESVELTVENNVLTIEGSSRVDPPEGYELVGQEFGMGRYRRDFTLASTVDTANIKARVHHGLLEVEIPKREEEKTRKIEVTS